MKLLLMIPAILVATVLVLSVGYVVYLLITDKRIPDCLQTEVEGNNRDILPAGKTIRITSWNIGFAAYSDDYSFFMNGGKESRALSPEAVYENMRSFIELMKTKDADIMLFQEVDTDSTRTYHINEKNILTNAFENHNRIFACNYHSAYLMWPLLKPHGASNSGMLTFVRAGIDNAVRKQLPIEQGLTRFFDLDRCYSVSRIPVSNGRYLYLFTLHLSAYTTDGSIATEQLRILFKEMQPLYNAGHYVIAGGDFNKDIWIDTSMYTHIQGRGQSWAKPFPTELIPEGFSIANTLDTNHIVTSGRASDTEYRPGETFVVTLDAFIVSDNVRVEESCVIAAGFKHSDHNPIDMKFTLLT